MEALEKISHVPTRAAEGTRDLLVRHLIGVIVNGDRRERSRDAREQVPHDRGHFGIR